MALIDPNEPEWVQHLDKIDPAKGLPTSEDYHNDRRKWFPPQKRVRGKQTPSFTNEYFEPFLATEACKVKKRKGTECVFCIPCMTDCAECGTSNVKMQVEYPL